MAAVALWVWKLWMGLLSHEENVCYGGSNVNLIQMTIIAIAMEYSRVAPCGLASVGVWVSGSFTGLLLSLPTWPGGACILVDVGSMTSATFQGHI